MCACVWVHVCVYSVPRRHFLHCLSFLMNSFPPLPAEPLREHQKRALQNPRGRWEWSDSHVLQPRQRRLALKAWYVEKCILDDVYLCQESLNSGLRSSVLHFPGHSCFVFVLFVCNYFTMCFLEVDSTWAIMVECCKSCYLEFVSFSRS